MNYFDHSSTFLLLVKEITAKPKTSLYYLISPDQLHNFYHKGYSLKYCLEFSLNGDINHKILCNKISDALEKYLELDSKPDVFYYRYWGRYSFKIWIDTLSENFRIPSVLDNESVKEFHERFEWFKDAIYDDVLEGY